MVGTGICLCLKITTDRYRTTLSQLYLQMFSFKEGLDPAPRKKSLSGFWIRHRTQHYKKEHGNDENETTKKQNKKIP